MLKRADIYRLWAWRSARWALRRAGARAGLYRVPPPPRELEVPAQDWWGDVAERQATQPSLGWLDHSWIVREYVWPQVFGEVRGDTWGQNAARAFGIAPGGRWLSLGCGSGILEVEMVADGLCGSMHALDASQRAVEAARARAAERGIDNIRFDVADLNTAHLPEESYDVVIANMALHHVSALEHLAYQVNRALAPGGVLLANEFVGPNQFQYSDDRLQLVSERLALLPERLRWNPIAEEVKSVYPRFSRDFWRDFDPTESVRSDEIPGALKLNFPDMRRYDYGGSILNLVLENIVQNFNLDEPADRKYLEDLIAFEQEMTSSGRLPSDFAYFVCPKGPARALARGRVAARLDLRHRVTMSLRSRALA